MLPIHKISARNALRFRENTELVTLLLSQLTPYKQIVCFMLLFYFAFVFDFVLQLVICVLRIFFYYISLILFFFIFCQVSLFCGAICGSQINVFMFIFLSFVVKKLIDGMSILYQCAVFLIFLYLHFSTFSIYFF